jgi:hypothetical protein
MLNKTLHALYVAAPAPRPSHAAGAPPWRSAMDFAVPPKGAAAYRSAFDLIDASAPGTWRSALDFADAKAGLGSAMDVGGASPVESAWAVFEQHGWPCAFDFPA